MAAPPAAGGAPMPTIDPKLRNLWIQLPQLINQARLGTLAPEAASQLRTMIGRQGNEIMAFYRASGQPNPLANLPGVLDPAQQAGRLAPPPGAAGAPGTNGTASPQLAPGQAALAPSAQSKPAPSQQEQIQSTLNAMEKMNAKQREAWFQKIPGIESMFNKFMEMRQKQAAAGRTASPVPGQGAPPPAAAPAQGVPTNSGAEMPPQMPPMNLAIPPGAMRGNPPAPAPTAPQIPPPSAPPAQPTPPPAAPSRAPSNPAPSESRSSSALSSAPPVPGPGETAPPLDKNRVTFYMNLPEAEAIKLPAIQHKQWLWVKNAIREQQLKAAKSAAGGAGAARSTPSTPASAGPGTGGRAGATPTPTPQGGGPNKGTSAYAHLPLETLLQMYARTGQPITDDVRRQLSALAADGSRAQAQGQGQAGALPAPPTPVSMKSDRQVAEENVARMLSGVNGVGAVTPAVREIMTDLAEDLLADALDGAARVAKTRSRTEKAVSLKAQDVVTYMNQTYGIYVPGFGLPPPIDAFNAGSEVRYTASRQRRLQHVHKARISRAPVKQEDVDMEK